MANKRLPQYKGSLSSGQLAAGMNAANANARRLLEDAETLVKQRRYPTSAALAVLAIEEAGKLSILRKLALARSDDELRDAWRDYRSHKRKNLMWMFTELVAKGAELLDDFRPLFDANSDHPLLLDQVKQISFYTDCLGNAHWSIPEEAVEQALAEGLVAIARLLVHDRVVQTEEMELWVKFLGPVHNSSPKWQRKALAEWHRELVRRGLADGDENGMENFIWGPRP